MASDLSIGHEKYFHESALRFARFYNICAQENQNEFNLLDIEFDNILAALNIFDEAGDIFMVGSTTLYVQLYCDQRGYWQTLRYWLEIAWKNRHRIANNELVCRIVLGLAELVSIQGDRSSAYALYQDAIEIAVGLERDDLLGEVYLAYGVLLLNTGRMAEAFQIWQQAKILAERTQNDGLIAGSALMNDLYEATINTSIGENALKDLTKRLLGNFGESGKITIMMVTATFMLQKRRYESARQLFSKALVMFKEAGERQGEALALYNLGLIAENMENHAQALHCYHNSLSIAQELNDQTGLTGLYYSLGMLHLHRDEFEDARDYLGKCVTNVRRDGDKKMLSERLYWYGYALANSGQVKKAIQVFLECKSLSSELGTLNEINPEKELETLRGLQGT